jgi:hypothetical protein
LQTTGALRKLKSFVLSTQPKSIELGTLAMIINEALEPNNTADFRGKLLIRQIELLPFRRKAEKLANDILFLTRNYRNKAAHKAILSYQDMVECRNFILGNNNNDGLLTKIVKIG